MEFLYSLSINSLLKVWAAFVHNWPFLVVSIVIAGFLGTHLDTKQVAAFLMRYRKAGVLAATAAAVGTPLCSCGTTAIMLGMMAGMMPWAPIIAFMVSSPLTSPQELFYSAGLFGWPFAIAFFVASIFLGLAGGWLGGFFEEHGWLKNQVRINLSVNDERKDTIPPAANAKPVPAFAWNPAARLQPASACGCQAEPVNIGGIIPTHTNSEPESRTSCGCSSNPASASIPEPQTSCGCSSTPTISTPEPQTSCACSSTPTTSPTEEPTPVRRIHWRAWAKESGQVGLRLVWMFFGFAFLGYFINGLIPTAWVTAIFGSGNVYSVPLAATLGIPFYINSEASLPLVRAMLDNGMSQGAALAFLITGSGTSIGAISGLLTIARWRVIALVIGTLWAGAILSGFLFDLLV